MLSRDTPEWLPEFAMAALANALGTLIAALVLFLGGVVLGAIHDVPAQSVVGATAALVGALAGAAVEARRARILRATARPIERARAATDLALATVAARQEVEGKLATARAAAESGDVARAKRLISEIEIAVADMEFQAEQAERYIGEAETIARQYGFSPKRQDSSDA